MDATSLIGGWKRRLTAVADDPPDVFRDTPGHLIDQHRRRLTTFAGYSELEVADAECRLRIQFPQVFRAFLLEMAKAPGDLFCGSDLAGITEYKKFRADALELLAVADPALNLPPEAVVFLFHQGYQFVYILAKGGFDTPAMLWSEMAPEPMVVAATFAELVEGELQLMKSNAARAREMGGYYLTLHPGGGATQTHPAVSSGDRPLDHR